MNTSIKAAVVLGVTAMVAMPSQAGAVSDAFAKFKDAIVVRVEQFKEKVGDKIAELKAKREERKEKVENLFADIKVKCEARRAERRQKIEEFKAKIEERFDGAHVSVEQRIGELMLKVHNFFTKSSVEKYQDLDSWKKLQEDVAAVEKFVDGLKSDSAARREAFKARLAEIRAKIEGSFAGIRESNRKVLADLLDQIRALFNRDVPEEDVQEIAALLNGENTVEATECKAIIEAIKEEGVEIPLSEDTTLVVNFDKKFAKISTTKGLEKSKFLASAEFTINVGAKYVALNLYFTKEINLRLLRKTFTGIEILISRESEKPVITFIEPEDED